MSWYRVESTREWTGYPRSQSNRKLSTIKMTREAAPDNRERRSGFDRRCFAYAVHIPERRKGKERRKASRYRCERPVKQIPTVEDD